MGQNQSTANEPEGFRLPGYRNLGSAAPVMSNGSVGPYKYKLEGRKYFLNPSKYQYRVVIPGGPVLKYVPLSTNIKLRNGDNVTPISPENGAVAYKINFVNKK